MKLLLFIAALTLASTTPHAADTAPQLPHLKAKTLQRTVSKNVEAQYLLHLPQGYNQSDSKQWPLILFLHGAGERGSDIWKVAVHGPPKISKDNPNFQFVLVSPQCPTDQRWSNDTLLALLDDVTSTLKIDRKRIYLTGLSMGGFGTWKLAAERPELFAAIAPICGGGEPIDIWLAGKTRTDSWKTMGIWAFHGAKDNVVPLAESERMVAALKRIGCTDVQFTVYPEANHDSWTETYNNPKLYEWFLRHSR